MTQERYTQRRAQLISELYELRKTNRFPRCVAARIRDIAKLDYEYDNTPMELTYKLFGYEPQLKR